MKCFQIRLVHRILTTNVTLNRMKVTITRTVPFVIYTMKLFPSVLELRYCTAFLLMFETFVNEKCINMINMKLTEDFVLFGNAKDFESDEIFNFIILFAKPFYTN